MFLYRAVDKYAATIDFHIRKKRDTQAARRFFRKAIRESGEPKKINVDKSGANISSARRYKPRVS